jgi:hypothetical protein
VGRCGGARCRGGQRIAGVVECRGPLAVAGVNGSDGVAESVQAVRALPSYHVADSSAVGDTL